MQHGTERDAAVRGRSVLITGASRGIGAATARRFAAAGARLGLAGRPSDALAAVAEETGATLIPCDVAEAAQVETAVARMVALHGRLDVLINNAGVIEPIALIASADAAAWGRQIDVNLKGVFHGMRAALPVMQKQGGGTILTVGSGAAYNVLEGWSGYCASKAGAIMLTRAAHLEAGSRVRVLSLARDGGDGHAAGDQGLGHERGQPAGLAEPYPCRMAGRGAALDVHRRRRRLPRRRGFPARRGHPRPAGACAMIRREDAGALTILTLDRPDKANSLTRAMMEQLVSDLRDAGATQQAVILTGAGKVFPRVPIWTRRGRGWPRTGSGRNCPAPWPRCLA